MVVQEIADHDRWDREPEWAHPDEYTVDDNWRTGFEFHSTDWTKQ